MSKVVENMEEYEKQERKTYELELPSGKTFEIYEPGTVTMMRLMKAADLPVATKPTPETLTKAMQALYGNREKVFEHIPRLVKKPTVTKENMGKMTEDDMMAIIQNVMEKARGMKGAKVAASFPDDAPGADVGGDGTPDEPASK